MKVRKEKWKKIKMRIQVTSSNTTKTVFNRDTPVDQSNLDKLDQCPTNDSIGDALTVKEIRDII